MTDEELRQLIASNARAIEAAAGERVELRQAILKLTELQQGVVKLLSQMDEDRPTILRKLTAIKNKVDQLLEKQDDGKK
jgi:hypothetical protein